MEKNLGDKYHTARLGVNPQCFPLSTVKRDKAHGDASPSIVTDRGRDSGVNGVKQRPMAEGEGEGRGGNAVTAQHSTCLRLVGRTGPRFFRLDPILTEPIGLEGEISQGKDASVVSGHTK